MIRIQDKVWVNREHIVSLVEGDLNTNSGRLSCYMVTGIIYRVDLYAMAEMVAMCGEITTDRA